MLLYVGECRPQSLLSPYSFVPRWNFTNFGCLWPFTRRRGRVRSCLVRCLSFTWHHNLHFSAHHRPNLVWKNDSCISRNIPVEPIIFRYGEIMTSSDTSFPSSSHRPYNQYRFLRQSDIFIRFFLTIRFGLTLGWSYVHGGISIRYDTALPTGGKSVWGHRPTGLLLCVVYKNASS